MDNPFFSSFMKRRLGFSHQFVSVFAIRFLCRANVLFQVFKRGFYRSVSKPSDLTLFCTFFCRFMVSQLGLAPCLNVINLKFCYISNLKRYLII